MAGGHAESSNIEGTPASDHLLPPLPASLPLSSFTSQVPECMVEIEVLEKSTSPNNEHKISFRGVAVTIPITVPDWESDMPVMVMKDVEHEDEERRRFSRRRRRRS